MPKLEYFLVAESISIDRDTNQISLFNVLEEVAFSRSTEHWAIPQLVACSSWKCEQEDLNQDFQVAVEIVQPNRDGSKKETNRYSVNFTAAGPRNRICLHYGNLPIHAPGDIVFTLLLNGEQRATQTLTVRQVEEGET